MRSRCPSLALAHPGTWAMRGHGPAACYLLDIVDLLLRHDVGPCTLCEPQVVLVERVLRVEPTTDHAVTAGNTPRSSRSFASEVGVIDLDARLTEVHRYWRWAE